MNSTAIIEAYRRAQRYRLPLAFLYGLLIALPAALAIALTGPQPLHYRLAKIFALLGFMILALQPVLSARLRWLDRPFGLNMLYIVHKVMPLVALLLLSAHPFVLAAALDRWPLLTNFQQPWYILLGKAALLLLWATVVVSLFYELLRLTFEQWRVAHNVLVLALLAAGFAHSIAVGSDLQLWPLRAAWIAALATALAAYIHHMVIVPWRRRRNMFVVDQVQRETDSVWTITLISERHRPLDHLPGQFQFIRFHRGRDLPDEEHHFTISSSPAAEKYHESTIKEVGDFTAAIGRTKPGDKASVEAPFGHFSYTLGRADGDLVFIAGGIGITPLMSMLRHMRDTRSTRRVTLLYANRTQESIVFRRELDEIAAGGHPRLTVVHVLSRPDESWNGPSGHIDRDFIRRRVEGDLSVCDFYVCGPLAMMRDIIGALLDLKVSDSRIHYERFAL